MISISASDKLLAYVTDACRHLNVERNELVRKLIQQQMEGYRLLRPPAKRYAPLPPVSTNVERWNVYVSDKAYDWVEAACYQAGHLPRAGVVYFLLCDYLGIWPFTSYTNLEL
jgi:hypothetical protein